jgi:hypothetical protein
MNTLSHRASQASFNYSLLSDSALSSFWSKTSIFTILGVSDGEEA